MANIFEILKIILPAITTGLCTFLITKYTYNKNIPLDKLEIAYNRVYYPLYKIISNKDINDIDKVIDTSRLYFNKYDKYIDKSTIRLFNSLCQCNKKTQKKTIYRSFTDNIYDRHSYLRRRLGYLEPNLLQMYKYSTESTKSLFRMVIEYSIMYIIAMLSTIMSPKIYNILLTIFAFFLLLILAEIIRLFLRAIYYKIRK